MFRGLIARSTIEIADGDLGIGLTLKKTLNEYFALAGHATYLQSIKGLEAVHLAVLHKPNSFIDMAIVYSNYSDDKAIVDPGSNSGSLGIINLKWLIDSNDKTKLGVDYELDLDSQLPKLSFGFLTSALSKSSLVKTIVRSDGELENTINYKLNDYISLSASTTFDLQQFKSEMDWDFGIGWEFNI